MQIVNNEILSCTDSQMISSIYSSVQPPRYSTVFTVLIPVYQEMEIPFHGSPNLITCLASIANAGLLYSKSGFGSIDEIEVFCNINNEIAPTENVLFDNRCALKLITLINQSDETAESIFSELYKNTVFINQSQRQNIVNEIAVILLAVSKGLNIYGIDCTNGKYIARYNDNDLIVEPNSNQGSRSRILSILASTRYASVKQQSGYQIRLDADCELPAKYFIESKQAINKYPNKIISRARIFIPQKQVQCNEDIEYQRIISANQDYQYQDFTGLLQIIYESKRKDFVLGGIRNSLAGSMGNLLIPDNAIQQVNWYPIHQLTVDGSTEDTCLISKLTQRISNQYIKASPVFFSHRIRANSWMGKLCDWETPFIYTFIPTVQNAIASLLHNELGISTNNHISCSQFPLLLKKVLMKYCETESELRVVNEHFDAFPEIENITEMLGINSILCTAIQNPEELPKSVNSFTIKLAEIFSGLPQYILCKSTFV